MKSILICLILLAIASSSVQLLAEEDLVPFETIEKIAKTNATSLWGDVNETEAIPYYGRDEEIVAYVFNFAVGHPFPPTEEILQSSESARKDNNKKKRWGVDEYAHMVVGARYTVPPIIEYSKSLSGEFAYGLELEERAREALAVSSPELVKIYYLAPEAEWYVYTNSRDTVCIRLFPPPKTLSLRQFNGEIRNLEEWNPLLGPSPRDFRQLWSEYEIGKEVLSPRANHFIPMYEQMPYNDWSYGCTPTTYAMLAGYWDNYGFYTASNYSKLVDYHIERWDMVQAETDYNVSNIQREFAIAMNTDTTTGGTGETGWTNGCTYVTNTLNGYNFSYHNYYGTASQYWDTLTSCIDNGIPVHLGTPGHSNAGMGYTDNHYAIRHSTEGATWNTVYYTSIDLVGPFIPGGASGWTIKLASPNGDPGYNHDGNGEILRAGESYTITWAYDGGAGGSVRIEYSTDGGSTWSTITTGTSNDGSYLWNVPQTLSTNEGRIRLKLNSSKDRVLWGGDGSWGNFIIQATPDLVHYKPAGWTYPVVPRSSTGATSSTCVLPSTLPGNSSSTYLNMQGKNQGNASAGGFSHHFYIDGVYAGGASWGGVSAGQRFWHGNYGTFNVRGGRHTISDSVDVGNSINESNENNNFYARQFVWSPLFLAQDTSIYRSSPPPERYTGITAYPNCDGFSFNSSSGSWWTAVGILPSLSGNDYDLRLHNDYVGSEVGFGTYLESSTYGTDRSDFLLVNYNVTSGTYYTGVNRYSGGTSGFRINRSDAPYHGSGSCTTSVDTLDWGHIVNIHEFRLYGGNFYRIALDHLTGAADLGISIYNGKDTVFAKVDYMSGGAANADPDSGDEVFSITISDTGYYCVAVWKDDQAGLYTSNTYRLIIQEGGAGDWIGVTSSDWHTWSNWFGSSVPSSGLDVTIPAGTPYSPIIYSSHTYCNKLTIDSGARLVVANAIDLTVNSHLIFNGTLKDSAGGTIYVKGNWQDYGIFEWEAPSYSYVRLNGSGLQYIVGGDFYDLSIYGTGNTVRIIWTDLDVEDNLYVHNTLDTYDNGYAINARNIYIYDTAILDAQTYSLGVNTVSNIWIQSGGFLNTANDNSSVVCGEDILIYGTLYCGTRYPDIFCGRNWVDTTGTFNEGYSTVCFNGIGTQDIMGGETFWDVVVDKTAGKLRPYDAGITIHSLYIENGTFDLNSYDADITSDATIRGHLEMVHSLDDFNVDDDIIWDSTATATITDGEIRCGDDFDVHYGAGIQMSGGTVYFVGALNSYIHMYDPDFSFHNFRVIKDSGYWLKISTLSTHPVDVNGYFYNDNLSIFDTQTETIEVAGNWTNNGTFSPTSGLVRFDGISQFIDNGSGNFWDLEIDVSSTLTTNDNLDVDDDFTILSGTFNPGSYDTYVGGDWNDTLGTFQPASASNWVIFDGNGQQLIYQKDSNHFQGVEIWNTGTSPSQVRAETDLDILWYFNITSGYFNVNGQDLYITNALQLGYMPSHDGNLTQYDGAIHCNGVRWYAGTVDLQGGTICSSFDNTSYPDWNDTLITFQASGNHAVEMIGSTDITIIQKSGNYFNNLAINKHAKQKSPDRKQDLDIPITCTGLLPPPIPRESKTNTVLANTDFDINGNLLISNGVLDPSGHTLRIAGNWTNDVGDVGFVEGMDAVIFDGATSSDILTDETFYDLTLDKTYPNYDGLETGTDGNGKNINVLDNLNIVDGTMELNVPCTLNVEGDVQIALNAGLNGNDGYNICIYIGGNWIDDNPVHSGTYGFDYGISDVIFDGNGFQDISGDSVNFYNLELSTVNPTPHYEDLELTGANKLLRIHNDLRLERGGMEINGNSILDIDGSVLIDSAAGLDADDGGIKIHVAGNWTNTGNYVIEGGGPTDGFDEYTSSVIFDGTSESHIGEDTFDTLRIDKESAKENAPLKYWGELYEQAEESEEEIEPYYGKGSLGKADSTAYADSTIIASNIWVDTGNLETSGHIIRAYDDVNISGALRLDAGAVLEVGDTLNVNNGGRLECTGTDTSQTARVTRTGSGYYAFNVNAGGTVSPIYSIFEYMGSNGIHITGCGAVDTSTSFDYCRFRNGKSGGTLMQIDNSQDIQIVDAIFPENTWGGSHNVSKLENQGTVTFIYPYGDFAGENFEDDLYNRIFWTVDTAGPVVSYVYPPQDTLMRDNLPTIEARYYDSETGIKTSTVFLQLDGSSVSATVTDSSVEYTPTVALSDTVHEVELSVSDNRDNQTIFSWEFEVDASAPLPPPLSYPPDSSWVGDTTVCFQWGEVVKSISNDNKWQIVSCPSAYNDLNLSDIHTDELKVRPTSYIDEQVNTGNRKVSTVEKADQSLSDANIIGEGRYMGAPKASEVSYIIQVDTSESFIDPIIIDTTNQPLDTLNLDQDHYYWRVKAYDLAGNIGDFSSSWEFGIDITPPDSFDLISPLDSTCQGTNRPTFLWHSTTDTACGFWGYHAYVDGDLKNTGLDTSWTADYDLSEGYHNWYIVAVDSVGNAKQSNQVWALLIDTQPPEIESTTVWRDTTFTGPFPINTNVSDTNGVSKVELWYRTSVDTNWVNIAMDTAKAVVEFTGVIPTQPCNTTVDYYIYVEDNAQPPNEARDPVNAPDSTYSFTVVSGTSVMEENPVPDVFFLSQNHPNPFCQSTCIEFGLPIKSYVGISIYNISGFRVAKLIDQEMKAGYYETRWDGRNDKGDNAPQGIYFCQFTTESFCKVRKIVLLR